MHKDGKYVLADTSIGFWSEGLRDGNSVNFVKTFKGCRKVNGTKRPIKSSVRINLYQSSDKSVSDYEF